MNFFHRKKKQSLFNSSSIPSHVFRHKGFAILRALRALAPARITHH